MRLGMSWSHAGQRIFCDEEVFAHEGPINTDPTHDCAHLLVAANGGMLWRPVGDPDQIRIAEYNASVLEHLLDETFNYAGYRPTRQTQGRQEVIEKAVQYAVWFVEKHFTPFPMSAKEALKVFTSKLNEESIVRLSPHFFTMKRSERMNARQFKRGQVDLAFSDDDCPAVDDEIGRLQTMVREELPQLREAC